MSLLNYTTTIRAEKTANEITTILVRGGARQIMSEFDEKGNVSGVSFSIETLTGVRGFTLPVKEGPVEAVMRRDNKIPQRLKTKDQARNVAWRITKDWLEAQMALIETEMVSFDQVMLPYMRSLDGSTLYEQYVAGHEMQPALSAPKSRD